MKNNNVDNDVVFGSSNNFNNDDDGLQVVEGEARMNTF
jgi:hypothetical protein